jgi:predicted MPP superfamily phosphohydrolase
VKIAHISDIHIRGLTRHDEIKAILESFINQCKEEEIDHIFVLGDIWHTKTTGLSAEAVRFMSWMFTSLAEVATTHVILGNHDLNLTNLSRMDVISPILEALNNPKIKFYKNSGVFKIEDGYNACLFSVTDKENWSLVKPVKDEFNIALFHGCVAGAKNEDGFELPGEVDIAFFNEYDMVLLGDIHKWQFLG